MTSNYNEVYIFPQFVIPSSVKILFKKQDMPLFVQSLLPCAIMAAKHVICRSENPRNVSSADLEITWDWLNFACLVTTITIA